MTRSTSAVAVCCSRDAQFIEEPRVLNGDDGLFGEIVNQLDLLVSEWPHLLAVDIDDADQFVLFEHRHDKERPRLGQFGYGNCCRIAFDVRLFRHEVGNMHHLLCADDATRGLVGMGQASIGSRLRFSIHADGALCSATFRNVRPS